MPLSGSRPALASIPSTDGYGFLSPRITDLHLISPHLTLPHLQHHHLQHLTSSITTSSITLSYLEVPTAMRPSLRLSCHRELPVRSTMSSSMSTSPPIPTASPPPPHQAPHLSITTSSTPTASPTAPAASPIPRCLPASIACSIIDTTMRCSPTTPPPPTPRLQYLRRLHHRHHDAKRFYYRSRVHAFPAIQKRFSDYIGRYPGIRSHEHESTNFIESASA